MAKGKNTAALFEVMGKGGGASPKGPLGTPSWWNKGKSDAPTPNLEPGAAPPPPAPPMEAVGPTNRLELDGDRQELRVRMSYTMVAVGLFAVVLSLGLAVVIGREMGSRPSRPLTTPALQRGPAEPGVLNVPRNGNGNAGNTPGGASPVEPPQNGAGGTPSPSPNPPPNGGNEPGPVAPPGKVTRTVGLTYVIVQSYPTQAEAQTVIDFLASKGIATSAERLPVFNKKGWWTVVSAEGYPRTEKASLDALKRRMDQASVEKAQVDKKWKALTPQSFRWQG